MRRCTAAAQQESTVRSTSNVSLLHAHATFTLHHIHACAALALTTDLDEQRSGCATRRRQCEPSKSRKRPLSAFCCFCSPQVAHPRTARHTPPLLHASCTHMWSTCEHAVAACMQQRCCASTAVSAAQQKSEPVRAAAAHHQQIDSHMESSLRSREKVQIAHTAASSQQ